MKNILAAILVGASALVATTATTTLAQGGSLADAKALYAKGDFDDASTMAAKLGSYEGLVLAAKANSIYASTRPEKEQDALYIKSEELARKAIDLSEKQSDGYFELARSLGRLSQLRGVLTALMQGLGGKVKDALDTALKYNANNASALVALGLWHAEVSAKGALAAISLGATFDKVEPNMEKAIKLEPKVIVHRVEYAKALLLIDKNKNKARAIEQLETAVKLAPRDAADKLDLEKAKRDLAALK